MPQSDSSVSAYMATIMATGKAFSEYRKMVDSGHSMSLEAFMSNTEIPPKVWDSLLRYYFQLELR